MSPDPTRRSEASRQAILVATRELCGEIGYGRLTIEGIAARAGVGKKTIYRWWPSKAAVVTEMIDDTATRTAQHQDTGDLVADMRTQLLAVIDLVNPSATSPVAGVIADGLLDPEFGQIMRARLIDPRIEDFKQRLRAAQDAGQLNPEADLDIALDLFYGTIYHRLVFHLGMPDAAYLDKIMGYIVAALEHGPATTHS